MNGEYTELLQRAAEDCPQTGQELMRALHRHQTEAYYAATNGHYTEAREAEAQRSEVQRQIYNC